MLIRGNLVFRLSIIRFAYDFKDMIKLTEENVKFFKINSTIPNECKLFPQKIQLKRSIDVQIPKNRIINLIFVIFSIDFYQDKIRQDQESFEMPKSIDIHYSGLFLHRIVGEYNITGEIKYHNNKKDGCYTFMFEISDINECESNTHVCDKAHMKCETQIGGYLCVCEKGYELSHNCAILDKECKKRQICHDIDEVYII